MATAAGAGIEILGEPLTGGPLTRAVLAGSAATRAWYVARPASAGAWQTAMASVAAGTPRDWLSRLAPALGAFGRAERELARVALAGGVVITTGQQPGLFGGPLYTLYKALTARAVAERLERATGIPACALFWAATDDGDFEESASTAVAVQGSLRELQVAASPSRGQPLTSVPLGDVGPQLDVLAAACGSGADGSVLEAVRRAYVPTATVGGAYVTLLRLLLEPYGIPVLDAADGAVRRAGAPVLRAALQRADAVADALTARTAVLRAHGFQPQVTQVTGLTLVFESGRDGVRARVPIRRAAAVAADAADVTLGPNVLLRPLVERSILPSVAYVAGPAEIAYFAQVSAVADALGTAAPRVLPRWSGTLVEPAIRDALALTGASLHDLDDPHALEGRIAREEFPPAIRAALSEARTAIQHGFSTLDASVDDPALLRSVAGTRVQVEHRMARLERRLAARVKRDGSARLRAAATVRAALLPNGIPQERVLGFVPFLARHGPALVEELLAAMTEHAAALTGA